MQDVTKVVEQGFDFGVAEERRFVRGRRRKVAKQGHRRSLIFSIRQKLAADNFEFGEVIILSVARKHVEIEQAQWFPTGGVADRPELKIVNPFIWDRDFLELQAKNSLVDGKHSIEHLLEREKIP